MRLAFRVSYLGNRFYGSQQQAEYRTVEGEFINACRRLDLFDDWRAAGFLAAGRTDRGVHARGQVIAFSTPSHERAVSALNHQLPPDCWCTAVAEVPATFHPRFDARSRTYRYYFTEQFSHPGPMERAAACFLGRHDFSRFARIGGKNPVRNILSISIGHEGDTDYLEVTAESFLWHQVRCMASALAEVGTGNSTGEKIPRLLELKADRPLQPAPAEGLILWDTDVPVVWQPLDPSERSETYLEELRRHHSLMERVTGILRG